MQEKVIDFSTYSSIRIGPKIPVKIAQNLNEAILLQKTHFLIGGANNILLSPKNHAIFTLGKEFDYIIDKGDFIEVGASVSAKKVFAYFKSQNLALLEFLGTIPGKIGGIIKMNAGMKQYEVKNAIHSVCIDGIWHKNIAFSYRNSDISGVIIAVRFKKNAGFDSKIESQCKIMRSHQPKQPSAGSFFRNPSEIPLGFDRAKSAGELLDLAGFKGRRKGNVAFSEKHANFLINLGRGEFNDAISLIESAKDAVKKRFNITLKSEVVVKI